jgi:hypothetical protein
MSPKRAEIEVLLINPDGPLRFGVMGWSLGALAVTPALDRKMSCPGAPVFHKRQWTATHVGTGMTAGIPPGGDRSKASALAWARALLAAAPSGFWEDSGNLPGHDGSGLVGRSREAAAQLRDIAGRAGALYLQEHG